MKGKWMESDLGKGYAVAYNCTPSIVARSSFFYVQSVGHFRTDDKYYTRREGYRSYLMIYTVDGRGCAVYRGKHYELDKGKALLMDCYDYQEYYTRKGNFWEIKWIHFNGSSSSGYFDTIYENYGPVVSMPSDNLLEQHIDQVMELIRNGDVQMEVKASNIVVNMLTQIMLVASSASMGVNRGRYDAMIEKAIEYMERNHNSNISLKDVASAVHSSIYHFVRIFKKATGYSPYEYLVKYRINEAKFLLKSTDKTISRIAEEIGFQSVSNFIRMFKELEGMTPLKYRRYWKG